MVAVVGLLWIMWCVLGAARFRALLFFSLNAHGIPQVRGRLAPFTSLSSSARVGAGLHDLFSLSVCLLCVCVTCVVLQIARAVRDLSLIHI